jgi:hypothetical protein
VQKSSTLKPHVQSLAMKKSAQMTRPFRTRYHTMALATKRRQKLDRAFA